MSWLEKGRCVMRGNKMLTDSINESAAPNFRAAEIHIEFLRLCGSNSPQDVVILDLWHGDENVGASMRITARISTEEPAKSHEALVANIEALPLADNSVNAVICLGGVINHCDVTVAVAEFDRVIRPGGYLWLHFESSRNANFIGQKAFGRSAAIAKRQSGEDKTGWVYSLTFIGNLVRAVGFRIIRRTAIGAFSSCAIRVPGNAPLSILIRGLNSMVKFLPGLTRWATGYLVVCQKSI